MKTSKTTYLLFLVYIFLINTSCESHNDREKYLRIFSEYNKKVRNNDESKWSYTADTLKTWFDDKNGKPLLSIKGRKAVGKWKEWDNEMNSSGYFDSIWYDRKEIAIKGYFYEDNDFYHLIGKKPTKTLRTYWFNQQDKIHEVLIYWIPEENTKTTEHLTPIVQWAMKTDSTLINELYPDGHIIPSRENAKKWKALIKNYMALKGES